MLKVIILYILSKYNASTYRISRIIDEFFFPLLKSSLGSLAPALKKLENLGCVEFSEKMSDGGMKTKTYIITKEGRKHLVDLLLSFQSTNPYHIINEAKIALYCSDILSINELIRFKENLLNYLELYKIKLEKGLNNEYIALNEMQKKVVEITLDELEKLIKLL